MENITLEQRLGIDKYADLEQDLIMAEIEQKISEKALASLPEHKAAEFQEIVFDNHDHIDWWLAENDSNYEESGFYKEVVAAIKEEGEEISPKKVYATSKWIELNLPNYNSFIDEVVEEYSGYNWEPYLKERR